MVIFVLKSTQFSMNFHNKSKTKNWKIDFKFDSAHSAYFIKWEQNWGGGVYISFVGTEPECAESKEKSYIRLFDFYFLRYGYFCTKNCQFSMNFYDNSKKNWKIDFSFDLAYRSTFKKINRHHATILALQIFVKIYEKNHLKIKVKITFYFNMSWVTCYVQNFKFF